MSLPVPAPRRHLHTRTIKCEGFEPLPFFETEDRAAVTVQL